MTLLEHIIEKSGTPVTEEGIVEFNTLYGELLHLVTVTNTEGRLAGMAVLLPPVRLMGRTMCQAVVFGTDGTVPGKVLIEKMKDAARALGADCVIGATHRKAAQRQYAEQIARRYGGAVDSVNIRFDV